jgi:hypothetical protein
MFWAKLGDAVAASASATKSLTMTVADISSQESCNVGEDIHGYGGQTVMYFTHHRDALPRPPLLPPPQISRPAVALAEGAPPS